MRRCRVAGVTAALMWAAAAAGLAAQMFVSTGRDTLRGLPGVEVLVEMPLEAERHGMTRAAVGERVTARLRAGGVRVYASQSENESPAKPYLYVHVNVLEVPPRDLYAVGLQVHLRQTLRSPVTDSNIVNAMTWDAHNVIVVPAEGLPAVLEEVETYVDQFIDDWRRSR